MLYIIVFLIGLIIGMFIIALISVDTINESESLVRASRKSLKESEDKVEDLNEENKYLHEENKDLRFENEELRELLTEIADRSITRPLDSEKIVLDKIKELVRDYQSEN